MTNKTPCMQHRYIVSVFSSTDALLHLSRFNVNGLPAIVIRIGRRILYVLLALLAKYHVQDSIVGNLVIGQGCLVGERLLGRPLLGVGGVDPHLLGRYGAGGGRGRGRGIVAAAGQGIANLLLDFGNGLGGFHSNEEGCILPLAADAAMGWVERRGEREGSGNRNATDQNSMRKILGESESGDLSDRKTQRRTHIIFSSELMVACC